MEDEEGDEKDKGRDDEEEDGRSEESNSYAAQYNKKWGWISTVDTVAKTLNTDWDTVFNKNVVEYLNVLSYARDKAEFEAYQQKEYMNKIKNKRSY